MTGTLALVGSGEFLTGMRAIDAELLGRIARGGRPHIAVIPTAAVPDGPAVVARWAALGQAHFAALGASVDVIPIGAGARADDPAVAQRIAAAGLVYLSGGKPGFLLDTLRETPAWAAILAVYAGGGVIVGCSAGAMALGAALVAPRLGWPLATRPALGMVPGVLVLPHYDALPGLLRGLALRGLPEELTVVGIDEETALVQVDVGWQVQGRAGIELRRDGRRVRFGSGEIVTL
ncbi:type 1 glutamine amidotransferase-like domain-containing protein [Chloroflexales bacterium ZM16-3]|nr:type 1 glutamine amidotransferase-like domain-containing protein [Chloroflexales bacterium ZM16-3]